jgi:hypothetical protein
MLQSTIVALTPATATASFGVAIGFLMIALARLRH